MQILPGTLARLPTPILTNPTRFPARVRPFLQQVFLWISLTFLLFSQTSLLPLKNISYGVPKDWKFWGIIFSLALSILMTAIELVSRPFFVATSPGKVPERNI